MLLTELLSSVRALSRRDKFCLAQQLLAELAQEDGLPPGSYPVWSPSEAHEAATTLLQMLQEEKAAKK